MNGLLYDLFNAPVERAVLHAIRVEVLTPLSARVVEIGAGTGASFSCYAAGATVIAIEHDPFIMAPL